MMPQNNAMHQNGPVTMDACFSGPFADSGVFVEK